MFLQSSFKNLNLFRKLANCIILFVKKKLGYKRFCKTHIFKINKLIRIKCILKGYKYKSF